MSYTITVQIYQTNPDAFFRVVEETVWHGGTWSQVDGAYVLTIGGSGTYGSLRFKSDTDEYFIVTLGVHYYKGWGDIITNLSPSDTGVTITPQYYSDQHRNRERQREAQLVSYSVDKIGYNYSVSEGNNLVCKITIG